VTAEQLDGDFRANGFLGEAVQNATAAVRAGHPVAFRVAEDVNRVLQVAALYAMDTVQEELHAPNSVAVRLFLRGLQTYQGVVLMAERGMVADGQILLRSLLEDVFALAALCTEPAVFVDMLKADAHAARREQGRFLLANNLLGVGGPEVKAKLQTIVDEIGRDPAFISPKKVAALSPMQRQYLVYQKLSNDAGHVSAVSLRRHVSTDETRTSWCYRWGQGSADEIAFTLHQAVLAAIGIGVALTSLTSDTASNAAVAALAERVQRLPPGVSNPASA
jgi:hypothetical protein